MKLSDYLNNLVNGGKPLTAADVQVISAEVDVIKARATEKLTQEIDKLKETNKTYKEAADKLRDQEAEVELKKAFEEAGGDAEKFESFKKVAGKIEKLEEFNFEETFQEFPNLQGGDGTTYTVQKSTTNPSGGKTVQTGNIMVGDELSTMT